MHFTNKKFFISKYFLASGMGYTYLKANAKFTLAKSLKRALSRKFVPAKSLVKFNSRKLIPTKSSVEPNSRKLVPAKISSLKVELLLFLFYINDLYS